MQSKMKYLLPILLTLAGCRAMPSADAPLVLVFSLNEIPHEQVLRYQGYNVQRAPLPCAGDLRCWARDPQQLAQYVDDIHASLKGKRNVTLLGVSRGGYLVLRMADFPEVSRVIALSPVTDLAALDEYKGVTDAPPLNPMLVAGKPTFIQIGNADDRVSTRAALRYVGDAMNPKLTVVFSEGEGHSLLPADAMLDWLK